MPRVPSVELSQTRHRPRISFGPAVLLVADDPATSFPALHALYDAGYEVRFVRLDVGTDSELGKGLVRDQVELVVLDASRQSRAAMTLLEAFRATPNALPVIVITQAGADVRDEALRLGAQAVIDAPVDGSRLRSVAETLVPVLREYDIDEARGYSFH